MKLKRVESGHYKSVDGRVEIRRVVSQQTYRPDEILWSVSVDSKLQVLHYDTKKEAVVAARLFVMLTA